MTSKNTNPGNAATAGPNIENPVPNANNWYDAWDKHPFSLAIIEQAEYHLNPSNASAYIRLRSLAEAIKEHGSMAGQTATIVEQDNDSFMVIADFIIRCAEQPGRYSVAYQHISNALVLEGAANENQVCWLLKRMWAFNQRYQKSI